jgi:hypothetical protein
LDEFFVVVGRVESGEGFHEVVDLLLLFWLCLIQNCQAFQIQHIPVNHKILPVLSFLQSEIINIENSKLHVCLLFRIVIYLSVKTFKSEGSLTIEFHFGE